MLTNAAVRAARPRNRAYKISDGGGMYLHVLPSGSKVYRLKFYFAGRECVKTIGSWHEISLGEARARRESARALINNDQDPREAAVCKRAQVRNFEDAAYAWYTHARSGWTDVHAGDVMASLQRDVFPVIGAMPLAEITAPVVLAALRSIEGRGSIKTARRVRQRIGFIFDFAEAEGWTEGNPAEKTLRALAPAPVPGRQAAIIDAAELRQLLAAADRAVSPATVKLASRFLALTAVRLAAVRGARWVEIEDIDGDAPLWRVPAARMKLAVARKNDSKHDHLVPLSPAAVAVLRQARAITGDASLVFPGNASEVPIGEGAIGRLYMRAGFAGRHVPHGWRASFSTILNERLPSERGAIDRALGHASSKKEDEEEGIDRGVEQAYNRAIHLPRRRNLFNEWAFILQGSPQDFNNKANMPK